MADDKRAGGGGEKLSATGRFALTGRILAVNILPLLIMGGGLLYLDSYRTQLINERFKLARIEAQITAEALAGATRERQEALLVQIGKEQRMRLRMFDAKGTLTADSFALAEPSFRFNDINDDDWEQRFSRWLDRTVDTIVSAEAVQDYVEPEAQEADAWPELARARELGLSQVRLYDWRDGTPVITAAVPVGLQGATLLTVRNAVDITESVRAARTTLGFAMVLLLAASALLSLFLARTIVTPLRLLARAAVRVRQGRDREVEVPRLPQRSDEIGLLARAVSDMTGALRQRIDAVDTFAADVAHEIKNPLSSIRSAIETLRRIEDAEKQRRLLAIIAEDVARLDRLISDISDASRIDAELSRAPTEAVDLAPILSALAEIDEATRRPGDPRLVLAEGLGEGEVVVRAVADRLVQVLRNLIGNAQSFSPTDGVITLTARVDGREVEIAVEDAGPGIPEGKLESIFERFYSERPSGERFGQHSGLGLSISRQIVEALKGRIAAENRRDETGRVLGARFVVRLPRG